MAQIIIKDFLYSLSTLMRSIGYKEIYDRKRGIKSYIRKLGLRDFPRFHMQVNQSQKGEYILNLHYDLLHPLHKRVARATEADGAVVKEEVNRISEILNLKT